MAKRRGGKALLHATTSSQAGCAHPSPTCPNSYVLFVLHPEIRERSKSSTTAAADAASAGAGDGGDPNDAVAASFGLDSDDAISDLMDSDTDVRQTVTQNVPWGIPHKNQSWNPPRMTLFFAECM